MNAVEPNALLIMLLSFAVGIAFGFVIYRVITDIINKS